MNIILIKTVTIRNSGNNLSILQNTFDVSTLLGSNLRLALEHSVFPMDSKVIFELLKTSWQRDQQDHHVHSLSSGQRRVRPVPTSVRRESCFWCSTTTWRPGCPGDHDHDSQEDHDFQEDHDLFTGSSRWSWSSFWRRSWSFHIFPDRSRF